MIENPATGMLKYFLGKPIFEYSPSEYGAEFTKKTALWGWFNKPIKPIMQFGKLPPHRSVDDVFTPMNTRDKYERMNARSTCYYDFAKAFQIANP